MPSITAIKTDIASLTEYDLHDLFNYIGEIMAISTLTRNLPKDCRESRFASGSVCPYCKAESIIKHGKLNGRQRFKCKSCGKTFNDFSLSALANSKMPLTKWLEYAKCILLGYSIRKSASIVGVGVKTSFFMRYKILDAIRTYMGIGDIAGIIEMDETFVAESFKGNQKKSGFTIPPKSRKRGKEVNKRGISKEQVCIATTIDRNNNIIMEMVCKGRIRSKDLERLYGEHLDEGSIICTDSHKSYIHFSKNQNIEHIQIKRGHHKNGIYHISHINSLHSLFKGWLRPFNGVSTKYLSNYIHWFKWLQNFKAEKETVKAKIIIVHSTTKFLDCRIKQYKGREPIFV
jgi:transposase-like protein